MLIYFLYPSHAELFENFLFLKIEIAFRVCFVAHCLFHGLYSYVTQMQPMRGRCVLYHFQVNRSKVKVTWVVWIFAFTDLQFLVHLLRWSQIQDTINIVNGLSLDILKRESWTHVGCTANIIIKDVIHIFASISKTMCILLMGRRNRERWYLL